MRLMLSTQDRKKVGRLRSRIWRPIAATALAAAMTLGVATVAQAAEDVDLTPGPTVIADPNSPTGYTGHFVYYDPDATSVRFVADILLRNWADLSDTTVYQPQQYRPGLMRGGGGYDVEMTNAGNGYWYTDVPLAAGANQYWFYVDNNTNRWLADPANPPLFAPDGITGDARRSFNKVYVPYDAQKQNFAPLAARQIEVPRANTPKGTWSYVPITVNGAQRTVGVYLPPGYDANRAQPYKTIWMQHGGGQDQSDWLNMGNVPVIMDNLIADGATEPAVVVTTNTNYLGAAAQGYPNLRDVVLPFVEDNYNVSTQAQDRAFAGLSAGGIVTRNLINFDATLFGYYGVWSGGVGVRNDAANLGVPYILFGGGSWDFGLPNPAQVAALTNAQVENVVVAGAHDFNAWNQLFTIFARDFVWKPAAWSEPSITVKDGLQPVNGVYNQVPSLKLYDLGDVDYVVANGQRLERTNNRWSDLNAQNYSAVQGSNTIQLFDAAGNSSTFTFTLDSVAPTIASVTQVGNPKQENRVDVTVTFSEPISGSLGQGWYGSGATYTKAYYRGKTISLSFSDPYGNAGTATVEVKDLSELG